MTVNENGGAISSLCVFQAFYFLVYCEIGRFQVFDFAFLHLLPFDINFLRDNVAKSKLVYLGVLRFYDNACQLCSE
jgi:hypothetical protein